MATRIISADSINLKNLELASSSTNKKVDVGNQFKGALAKTEGGLERKFESSKDKSSNSEETKNGVSSNAGNQTIREDSGQGRKVSSKNSSSNRESDENADKDVSTEVSEKGNSLEQIQEVELQGPINTPLIQVADLQLDEGAMHNLEALSLENYSAAVGGDFDIQLNAASNELEAANLKVDNSLDDNKIESLRIETENATLSDEILVDDQNFPAVQFNDTQAKKAINVEINTDEIDLNIDANINTKIVANQPQDVREIETLASEENVSLTADAKEETEEAQIEELDSNESSTTSDLNSKVNVALTQNNEIRDSEAPRNTDTKAAAAGDRRNSTTDEAKSNINAPVQGLEQEISAKELFENDNFNQFSPDNSANTNILEMGNMISVDNDKLSISFNEISKLPDENIPHRADQVTMAVKAAVDSGKSVITLNMYPEALGSVDIKIEFSEVGKIQSIKVFAANRETLELLKTDYKILERSVSEVVKADDASLSFNLKDGRDNNGGYQTQEEINAMNSTNGDYVPKNYQLAVQIQKDDQVDITV